MSLNFDLRNINNRLEKYPNVKTKDGEEYNPVTHTLIWATMLIDLGEITEKNYEEFYLRIAAYESAKGPFIVYRDERGKQPITLEQVKDHIGLRTNVFPAATRLQWEKKLGKMLMQAEADHLWALRRQEAKEPAA